MSDTTTQIPENWIKVTEGMFICQECENESRPMTSSFEGMVEADIEDIKKQLTEAPTKIIYAVCPVCGMEYVFKLVGEDLYVEPSDEEK